MAKPVRGITFDFWRTLFYAYAGFEDRRAYRVRSLADVASISEDAAAQAIGFATREFLRVHVEEQRTMGPEASIELIEEHLERTFTEDESTQLVQHFVDAFFAHPPDPIEHAFEAVAAAAKHVPVGIISDTGMIPGRSLRKYLEQLGVKQHFTALTFSDELGVAKPQAAMFHHSAHQLELETHELLHIGDLEPTDVAGAHNVGASAALFAGDNRRFADDTLAQYTFTTWKAFVQTLPEILNGSPS